MLTLMVKDLERQKFLVITYIVALGVLTVLSGSGRQWIYLFGSIACLLVLSVVSPLVSERIEDRFSAYVLLKSLPVGVIRIVGAKFLLQFTVILIGSSAASVLACLFLGEAFLIRFGTVMFAWTFCVSLILVALCYVGVYALGMDRFSTVAKITALTLILIPQLALFYATKTKSMPDARNVQRIISESSLIIPLCIGVAIYAMGYVIAVSIRRRK